MRKTVEDFSRGLWLAGTTELSPPGTLRRAKNTNPIRLGSIRSRWGSELVGSGDAHSLVSYQDQILFGVGATLTDETGSVLKSGLDGSRLRFLAAPPSDGKPDYLYCSGGAALFKLTPDLAVQNWGIAEPADGAAAELSDEDIRTIAPFDEIGAWTNTSGDPGTPALVIDTAILQEGIASFKLTCVSGLLSGISVVFTEGVDLTTFDSGREVASEDYISIWVRMSHPQYVDYLQLMLSLQIDGGFDSDYYSYTVFVEAAGTEAGTNTPATRGTQDFLNSLGRDLDELTEKDRLAILEGLARPTLRIGAETWQQIKIPRALFSRVGDTTLGDWSTIGGLQIFAKLNAGGDSIIWLDDWHIHGGVGMVGTYKYKYTYRNSEAGIRSNPNDTEIEIAEVDRTPVLLTDIPEPSDDQVDQVEIWRTLGNGARFFLAGVIDRDTDGTWLGLDEYEDRTSDFFALDSREDATYLGNEELPLDNLQPSPTYDIAVGPHYGRTFWAGDTSEGSRAKVYYSPEGRPESVKGFIYTNHDDDPVRALAIFNQSIYAFTREHIYEILGTTEPFVPREVSGAPGIRLNAGNTVAVSEIGIFYKANDGVRLFDGTQSKLFFNDAVVTLFRGESPELFTDSFEGVIGIVARNEYLVSDQTDTLAVDIERRTWRHIALSIRAFFYNADNDNLIASWSGSVYRLEEEGVTTDDGAAIPFDIKLPLFVNDDDQLGSTQRIYIDMDTAAQTITAVATLGFDDAASEDVTIATFGSATNGRRLYEFAFARKFRTLSLRLHANVSARVTVYRIAYDIHAPEPVGARS